MYLLPSTSPLRKMLLGACRQGKLLFLHWAFSREIGTFKSFVKTRGAGKSQSKGNKNRIENFSTGIWYTSWTSLTLGLQIMHLSGLSCTFWSLLIKFPLIGSTFSSWSADMEYCFSGPLRWLLSNPSHLSFS